MNFFVIGLPRSRTAWLANFLTQDKFCFHEGLNECHNVAEYKKKLGDDNGDSSTGLMLLDMNNEFPNAPKVIIDGRIEAAIEYGYKTFGAYDPDYVNFLNERMKEIEGLRVHFNDIDNMLPQIWDHLISTPYDEKRGDMLKRMHVEIKDPFDFNFQAAQELCSSLN